ncbi:MAG: DUF6537 domain-containing protein, partial [Pseudomonadota bacterium]
EPRETEFGRKRKINLSSCNKDFSCLNGFCPSFVTIEGGERAKPKEAATDYTALAAGLPVPDHPPLTDIPFNLLVAGVGGTGVITVGALITMAAHLEGRGVSLLDFTGFAQKFGTVLSYIRIGASPDDVQQVRLDAGAADAVVGCDAVVSSSPKASQHYRAGTEVVLNTAEMPTGDLVLRRDADLKIGTRAAAIRATVGAGHVQAMDANRLAEDLLGDAVYANTILLGATWQNGMVPVGPEAIDRAIDLNGIKARQNRLAFAIGRLAVARPEAVLPPPAPEPDESLDALIERRAEFLTGYQDAAYADRYRGAINGFAAVLPAHLRQDLGAIAARALFKLMAYKDEYEVARLHTETGFDCEIAGAFQGPYRVRYHLAPPFLPTGTDARGRPRKISVGGWIRPGMRLLARMKRLRGTWADPIGWMAERRLQRALIDWYLAILADLPQRLDRVDATAILGAPLEMRGYGPVFEAAARSERARADALMQQDIAKAA